MGFNIACKGPHESRGARLRNLRIPHFGPELTSELLQQHGVAPVEHSVLAKLTGMLQAKITTRTVSQTNIRSAIFARLHSPQPVQVEKVVGPLETPSKRLLKFLHPDTEDYGGRAHARDTHAVINMFY